ncbi:MAG TPA: ATP-binding protein [Acidimicrobiales bacterium]|nr:ATP-binding protein [Acidimicrobiales bacterium]
MRFKPTIRLRLTLVYGGMFLAAGAILLAVNYALVQRGLNRQTGPVGVVIDPALGEPLPGSIDFVRPAPAPGQIVTADGQRLEQVLGAFEERLRDEALDQLVVQSSLALGLMAVVSLGLGWVLAGRVLRPIHDMTAAARRLSESNLSERLALEGPDDELKELADTFDDMLARLESAFESQRRFVANASHELRTPLAIQRTLVDVALADPNATPEELRATAASVRDAVDRSERLIDGLLVLARSQQGAGEVAPVDLAATSARAVDQVVGEAGARGIAVRRDLRPCMVRGNQVLLEHLAANLVRNAVVHNVDGGWMEVVTSPEGGRARLTVRNSGPRIPTEQVPQLFEPFRRLSPDRVDGGRGHGLGLSIVEAVATAHHGSVRAEPVEGGGLSVVVSLPAAGQENASAKSW